MNANQFVDIYHKAFYFVTKPLQGLQASLKVNGNGGKAKYSDTAVSILRHSIAQGIEVLVIILIEDYELRIVFMTSNLELLDKSRRLMCVTHCYCRFIRILVCKAVLIVERNNTVFCSIECKGDNER